MRMLKVRKKSISLIVVLTFLMTLFPLALPAFAADYTRLGSVNSVDDDDSQVLNTVRIETAAGELEADDAVIVSLPKDFDFNVSDWDFGTVGGNVYYGNYDDGCYIFVPAASDNGLNDGSIDIFTVEELDNNEISITVNDVEGYPSVVDDGQFFIYLKDVDVDEGYDGDIPLKFKAPSGSGFDSGEVIVGRVTGGEVEVEVTDDETFGEDGGEVTIRIEEDRAGALEDEDESVKFLLPDGFEWGNVSGVKVIFGDAITTADGKYEYGWFGFTPDEDELALDVKSPTNAATCIEFTAEIEVVDETDADLGDIVAKVKGESDVTPSEIIVGAYGDYSLEVTVEDPTTVYAGQLEQEIADFTIEEGIDGSLVDGRSITLTLPDWAKWGALDDSVSDGGVSLKLASFPGQDGTVAKYRVEVDGNPSAAELEFEDMEVVLSPDAPEGDLEIEISGTATDEKTIKVAEVKKPVEVSVDNAPTIVIGKAAQEIGTITITEADAEMLKEGEDLILELPRDVDWDDYDVEVTEGDLEIGKVNDSRETLTIRIDDESNEASTITITGSITAYRTVPEGEVNVDVYGNAVIEVNHHEAIVDYYNRDGSDLRLNGSSDTDPVAIDDYDEDDGLWEDDDTIAEVKAAYVGTPAPGEQQIKAVFTLGSTDWTLNDVPQTMDVAPYAKDGRTYLPMRYVAKALGIPDTGILWKAGTATFISADRVVAVTIGSNIMNINGAPVPIDAAPEIVNGRTMMPIRWIATAFGVSVDWNADTQEVTVN